MPAGVVLLPAAPASRARRIDRSQTGRPGLRLAVALARLPGVDMEVPAGVRDLSEEHRPLGALFGNTLPRTDDEWSRFELDEDQVKAYDRDGYLAGIPVLSEEQCDLLLGELAALSDPGKRHPGHGLFHEFHDNQTGNPDQVLLHALGHWRISPAFHDLVFLPQVAVPACQLLGGVAVRFWHDQLFAKPAGCGGPVAWHQDYSYWTRTEPMNHITVHIALDHQTEENGGLQFVPGSHRWGKRGRPLPVPDENFADVDAIKASLTKKELKNFKPVHGMLRKGEMSLHHGLCVHGSLPNRSDAPRRAAVLNFFADGTVSTVDGPLLDGATEWSAGERLRGQFHPVVFDPAWTSRWS